MSDLISKLSDLRSQYNCFDESERDAYDTLSEAIKVLSAQPEYTIAMQESDIDEAMKLVRDARVTILPSEEPETSRIEQELHGKTPEEQYEFIYWLLLKSAPALNYSNSRLAIIEWLRGEANE